VRVGDIEVGDEGVSVYPNPAVGGKVYLSTNKQQATIHVTDIQGKSITTQQTNADGMAVVDMQVKGLYVVKVVRADGVTTVRKLLVE
jgi:hypothetical protein